MRTTVNLPVELESRITLLSRKRKKTESQVIEDILESYFVIEDTEKDSYEAGKKYFGRYGSGQGHLSTNHKELTKEKLHAKYGSH
jgi:predicted DNA-binding protein